jgi:acid phosphatase class B
MNPKIPNSIFLDMDDTILAWSEQLMLYTAGHDDISGVTAQYDPSKFGGSSVMDVAMIMADPGFWGYLKFTSFGRKIIDLWREEKIGQDVILLTATPPIFDVPQWLNDKIQEVSSTSKRNFAEEYGLPIAIVSSHGSQEHWAKAKAILAGPDKIMVDDSPAMVSAFTKAGGQAILIPKPWNDATGDPIEILQFMCEPIEGVDF